ncbi:MAG: DsbA family protein [Gammaproteobacteria bacterium]
MMKFCTTLALIAFLGFAAPAWSATAKAPPAVDVAPLVPAQPSGSRADQVSVVAFFDFSPASRALLKRLNRWAANAGNEVVIDREPLITPTSSPLARAFMAARTLGIAQPVLDGLFNIRPDPAHPETTHHALAKLFQSWGAGTLEFNAAWSSAATSNGFIRAQSLAERFNITSAPAIVVDGLWRLTPTQPNDLADLFSALNNKVSAAALIASENQ